MSKAEEDLEVILDLLDDWKREYAQGYDVTAWINEDGRGLAYAFDGIRSIHNVLKEY